jgi:hypothetical protein
LRLWILLYAASGFCALALEVLWFRVLDVAVKSKATTFGTMLALYLVGCAAGCFLAVPVVNRLRRPLRAFLLAQCGLLAYAGLAMVLLTWLPTDTPGLYDIHQFWGRASYLHRHQRLLLLYGLLPAVLFLPATTLMGFSFPVLQRAVHDDRRSTGRKVGLLQAANIAGCVAGSLAVGLLGLRFIGTSGCLRVLMACGIAFAVVGLRTPGRRAQFAWMAALLALLAVMVPTQSRLWLRLHGTEDTMSLVREDATGVAALVPRRAAWLVFVDGKSHSWLPFGGVHTQLGATPSLVHPEPRDIAIIGLGSGDTAWASLCRPETRSLDVFEISGGQPRLLQRLADRDRLPDLVSFLKDPRLNIHVADGRHALASSGKEYDIIEADALWPDVAYAGNLYSTEFFRMCGGKLKPGGLVCTWAPTARVYASFISAFRYVMGPPNRGILLGSNEPIQVDIDAWNERLESEAVRRYLGERRIGIVSGLLQSLQLHNKRGGRPRGRDQNRDLFPRDEFIMDLYGEPF